MPVRQFHVAVDGELSLLVRLSASGLNAAMCGPG